MAEGEQLGISLGKYLHAHFLQPDGASLPGTDFVVTLAGGGFEKSVLVRVYDNGLPPDPVAGGRIARDYVVQLIKSGWKVYQYQDLPGELVAVPPIAQ
jgi:hypothetical protein